jgi:hypothetical protein
MYSRATDTLAADLHRLKVVIFSFLEVWVTMNYGKVKALDGQATLRTKYCKFGKVLKGKVHEIVDHFMVLHYFIVIVVICTLYSHEEKIHKEECLCSLPPSYSTYFTPKYSSMSSEA